MYKKQNLPVQQADGKVTELRLSTIIVQVLKTFIILVSVHACFTAPKVLKKLNCHWKNLFLKRSLSAFSSSHEIIVSSQTMYLGVAEHVQLAAKILPYDTE